jgi:hypothetical protein
MIFSLMNPAMTSAQHSLCSIQTKNQNLHYWPCNLGTTETTATKNTIWGFGLIWGCEGIGKSHFEEKFLKFVPLKESGMDIEKEIQS